MGRRLKRNQFATDGSRIFVDSRANGRLMGQEVRCDDRAVHIVLELLGTRPIVEATLIGDGKRLKTFSGNGQRDLRLIYRDDNLSKGMHWYYRRIAQEGQSPLYRGNAKAAHGHLAWSSPHWVIVPGNMDR